MIRLRATLVLTGLFAACGDSPADGVQAAREGAPETAPAEWPIYRGDTSLSGIAAGALPDSPTLLWTYETGGAITSSPVVHGGVVYVGSDDARLHAIDLEDGARVWAFATEDLIEAPPLVHDGLVFVGSSDYFLYAVEAATGELRWKKETEDRIVGSANHVQGPDGRSRIVVGSYDGRLYCYDARSGDELWSYATDNYVNGTPAILGDRIVFGGCDAGLHVVSAATGERISKLDLGAESYIAGSVGLAGGRAYFGHYGNAFLCVELEAGTTVWSYPSDDAFFSSPAIAADRVVFGGRDRKLHCARRADGTPLWTFEVRRKVDASPVISGDRVVFGSGDGRVHVLSLADGRELWSHDIGQSIFSSPAVVDGMILVGSNDGRLYAFGPEERTRNDR